MVLRTIVWSLNVEDDDGEEVKDISHVVEKDMAACLVSILKMLLAFNLSSDGVNAEYLAASLTVEAYSLSDGCSWMLDDEICIDPSVFCIWVSTVYELLENPVSHTANDDISICCLLRTQPIEPYL